jgi:hypothetical protein
MAVQVVEATVVRLVQELLAKETMALQEMVHRLGLVEEQARLLVARTAAAAVHTL